ncbi:hypothetical protein DNK57_07365, partial [Methanothermobacter thermautotrophicus]
AHPIHSHPPNTNKIEKIALLMLRSSYKLFQLHGILNPANVKIIRHGSSFNKTEKTLKSRKNEHKIMKDAGDGI